MEDASLTAQLETALRKRGAMLVGFADLCALPVHQREGFPVGIILGLPWDRDVLRGIEHGPTSDYRDNYDALNQHLDDLDAYAEAWLIERGYRALAKTQAIVNQSETQLSTLLPHKTVATRAGVGWIGKCALLVTPDFGAGLRISSVLTDAPLETGQPIDDSRCGDCTVCQRVCPAQAVSGVHWHAGLPREAFWDAKACRQTARSRCEQVLGYKITLCGLCVLHCPWTQRYLSL